MTYEQNIQNLWEQKYEILRNTGDLRLDFTTGDNKKVKVIKSFGEKIKVHGSEKSFYKIKVDKAIEEILKNQTDSEAIPLKLYLKPSPYSDENLEECLRDGLTLSFLSPLYSTAILSSVIHNTPAALLFTYEYQSPRECAIAVDKNPRVIAFVNKENLKPAVVLAHVERSVKNMHKQRIKSEEIQINFYAELTKDLAGYQKIAYKNVLNSLFPNQDIIKQRIGQWKQELSLTKQEEKNIKKLGMLKGTEEYVRTLINNLEIKVDSLYEDQGKNVQHGLDALHSSFTYNALTLAIEKSKKEINDKDIARQKRDSPEYNSRNKYFEAVKKQKVNILRNIGGKQFADMWNNSCENLPEDYFRKDCFNQKINNVIDRLVYDNTCHEDLPKPQLMTELCDFVDEKFEDTDLIKSYELLTDDGMMGAVREFNEEVFFYTRTENSFLLAFLPPADAPTTFASVIHNNPAALICTISFQHSQLCALAVDTDPRAIAFVQKENLTPEVVLTHAERSIKNMLSKGTNTDVIQKSFKEDLIKDLSGFQINHYTKVLDDFFTSPEIVKQKIIQWKTELPAEKHEKTIIANNENNLSDYERDKIQTSRFTNFMKSLKQKVDSFHEIPPMPVQQKKTDRQQGYER